MDRVRQDGVGREQSLLDLDEIARAEVRRMLAEALEAEVQDYLGCQRLARRARARLGGAQRPRQ